MPGCRELSIKEMLADPVVRALMSADGVHADELEALLCSVATLLRARSLSDGKGLPERKEAEVCGLDNGDLHAASISRG
jgi:hypothetical protein